MSRLPSLLVLLFVMPLALAGCGGKGVSHDPDDFKHDEDGPEGGHILKVNDKYLIEYTHDEASNEVTVIIREPKDRDELPIAAKQVELEATLQSGQTKKFSLKAIHADEGNRPKLTFAADTAAYIRCLDTDDAREGIAAFTEKRQAKFKGS